LAVVFIRGAVGLIRALGFYPLPKEERLMKAKLLLASALLLFFSDAAFGCVCVSIPSVTDSLKKADAVFSGRVESISNKRATLKIEQVWKGELSDEVVMLLGGSTFKPRRKATIKFPFTSCDYEFDVGERYLIYASRMGGKYFRTWRCTRTRRLQDAGEDLRELGPGKLSGSTGVNSIEALPFFNQRRSLTTHSTGRADSVLFIILPPVYIECRSRRAG
jgi:hypothetical protein